MSQIILPDGSTSSSTVDVVSSALPTGASTEATLALIKAKTDNLDVALSTRTKPADAQHVIVDSSASVAVTGPLTDTQLRASAVPVSAASLPLPSGAATSAKQDVTNATIASVGATAPTSALLAGAVDSAGDLAALHAKTISTQLQGTDVALVTNTVIHGYSTAGGGSYVDVKVNPSGALAADASGSTLGANSGVDIGDVTINNGSGASAVPIQDGGNSITVDGTVGVSGTVTVDGSGATQPISAVSLPLPSGAATETKQDTGNNSLSSIDGKTPALGQALAAGSVPVVLTAAQVSALTPPAAITGFLTESDFDTKVGALTESAPGTDTASSGLNGRLQRIAQRLTSLIGLLPTALGAGGGLKIDGSGTALPISGTVTADAGSGPFPVSDNAGSLTVDAPVGTPVFVRLSDGASAITTLPVSTASLPLPTGAATAALQTQPGVDIGDVTVNNGSGASAVNIQDGGNSITVDGPLTDTQLRATPVPVSGTFYPATQPVSGPLTDTELRASAVPVSGTVTVTQSTATSLKTQAEAYQGGSAVAAGNPLQVTLANTGANATAVKVDGSAVTQPVSGTVTATPTLPAWYIHHLPAANTQATITRAAAGVGVKNVCLGFTVTLAAQSTAPAAVQLSVSLIDGASGGGTYLWRSVISLPAIAGAVSSITLSNVYLVGTANTALTLEFSAAGGANTIESVSMRGTTL